MKLTPEIVPAGVPTRVALQLDPRLTHRQRPRQLRFELVFEVRDLITMKWRPVLRHDRSVIAYDGTPEGWGPPLEFTLVVPCHPFPASVGLYETRWIGELVEPRTVTRADDGPDTEVWAWFPLHVTRPSGRHLWTPPEPGSDPPMRWRDVPWLANAQPAPGQAISSEGIVTWGDGVQLNGHECLDHICGVQVSRCVAPDRFVLTLRLRSTRHVPDPPRSGPAVPDAIVLCTHTDAANLQGLAYTSDEALDQTSAEALRGLFGLLTLLDKPVGTWPTSATRRRDDDTSVAPSQQTVSAVEFARLPASTSALAARDRFGATLEPDGHFEALAGMIAVVNPVRPGLLGRLFGGKQAPRTTMVRGRLSAGQVVRHMLRASVSIPLGTADPKDDFSVELVQWVWLGDDRRHAEASSPFVPTCTFEQSGGQTVATVTFRMESFEPSFVVESDAGQPLGTGYYLQWVIAGDIPVAGRVPLWLLPIAP